VARLITPDGVGNRDLFPLDMGVFEVEEIYAAIGCQWGYAEWHRVSPDTVLVMDEDGKRKKLDPNPFATALMGRKLPQDDMVRGTVLVCSALEAGYNDDE